MGILPSPRHTSEDVRAWALWAKRDARMAVLWRDMLNRMADRSIAAIREFGDAYAGVSWGKDSVVLTHLIHCAGVKIPVVWMRWQGANPDCCLVRDAFLPKWPVQYDEIDSPEMTGSGFERAEQRYGHRHISGVRADESRVRLIRCRQWGLASPRTLAPLAWWRLEHVFAWLTLHDLPIHPAYGCSYGGGLAREDIRVDMLGGLQGAGRGRREWEWTYYREELEARGLDLRVIDTRPA